MPLSDRLRYQFSFSSVSPTAGRIIASGHLVLYFRIGNQLQSGLIRIDEPDCRVRKQFVVLCPRFRAQITLEQICMVIYPFVGYAVPGRMQIENSKSCALSAVV